MDGVQTTSNRLETDNDGHLSILFTDVEGSTRGWESAYEQMSASLAAHDDIVRTVVSELGGYIFSVAGDSFGAVFGTPDVARDAALVIQDRIATANWPDDFALRVRMSLHRGPVIQRDNGAYGPEIVRAAILCELGHAGQILLTEEFAESVPESDRRFLGSHRLRKISEPQSVYQHGQNEFGRLRNVVKRTSTVPAARNTLLGRDAQIAELLPLLEENRLITLTGPGGVGKTRLACELALRTFEHNFDGVHLVDLESIDNERDLVGAFAQGLELTLLPDREPVDQLLSFLAGRRSLLVVDNCEHLIAPAGVLVDQLLGRTNEVSLIATSREPLELDGEMVWRVPTLEPGVRSPATELFLRSAGPRSIERLDNEAALQHIQQICTMLDGLPLAIELAAARTRSLPVAAIAELLGEHQPTLDLRASRSARSTRTLEDVVAWSHALLNEAEKQAFARLSVFTGGFSMEDVPAVLDCGVAEAHELVDGLVLRSLVETVATARGGIRLRMLNTIRAYAMQQLKSTGDHEVTAERHCQRFLALAERPQHPYMPSPKVAQRHEAEYLNLRAAAEWAMSQGNPTVASRIATGAVIEIDRRGEFENGIRWSRSVDGGSDQTAFNALVTEAFLRGQEGTLSVESSLAQAAVDLAGDNSYRLLPIAISLSSLAEMTSDPEQAEQRLAVAYDVADRGDQPMLNRAFIDVHMASFDLANREPERLLERLAFYQGGMVNYARVSAHLMRGDHDAAGAVVAAAADQPADAWVHFNELADAMYLTAIGRLAAAAVRLTDGASRDAGQRRWQDGDYLVHFALLHSAAGNQDRAMELIDNCRSRHGLISGTTLQLKQTLSGWPLDYASPQSLDWLAQQYSPEATKRILRGQPHLLTEEIDTWRAFVEADADRPADSVVT